MPDIKKIDTSKYTKEGKVEVDGKIWSVVLPGAGTELKLSKAIRRQEFLAKKLEKGDATEADLDKLDEIEDFIMSVYTGLFKDDTADNSDVTEWMNSTPLAIIVQAFEDIKEQANGE